MRWDSAHFVGHVLFTRSEGRGTYGEEPVVRRIDRNIAHLGGYAAWTIGTAVSPDRRQMELRSPAFWRYWQTESTQTAARVQQHFVRRGMKRDPSSRRRGSYVYLY